MFYLFLYMTHCYVKDICYCVFQINGENVIRASHDRVVHLIRSTGDTLAMKVVTVKQGQRGQADWFSQQDRSLTMPNRQKKKGSFKSTLSEITSDSPPLTQNWKLHIPFPEKKLNYNKPERFE